jgi:hypothetical protein
MACPPNRTLHALGRNRAGDLVYFGDVHCGILTNEVLDPRVGDFRVTSAKSPGPIRMGVAGLKDDFWNLGPSSLHLWDGKRPPMAGAGEIGRITDDKNRYYTKCRVPDVGWYHNEQLGDYEYGIVTAFPVHPNW